jgi:hypothetical protein
MNGLKLWQLYRLRARAVRSGSASRLVQIESLIDARIAAIGGGL